MSIYSIPKSGKDNPYTEILGEHYLINADGQEVKRTKAHPTRPAIIRFLEKIVVSEICFWNGSPCWEWQGVKANGYGQFRIDGRRGSPLSSPHIFSHKNFIGIVPDGYEVDHLCRNRGCASPFHLEAITLQENRKRRGEAITHCKSGHEFTVENTSIRKNGARSCKACNRDRQKMFRQANPDAQKRYRV